jgi:hypothetical protein
MAWHTVAEKKKVGLWRLACIRAGNEIKLESGMKMHTFEGTTVNKGRVAKILSPSFNIHEKNRHCEAAPHALQRKIQPL